MGCPLEQLLANEGGTATDRLQVDSDLAGPVGSWILGPVIDHLDNGCCQPGILPGEGVMVDEGQLQSPVVLQCGKIDLIPVGTEKEREHCSD